MITTQVPQPDDADEFTLLTGWLLFHRSALARKCDGLTDEQLVAATAPPSPLSLLGLVRHMTEMERVYAGWPLTGDGPKVFVYCTHDDEDADIIGLRAEFATDSLRRWHDECWASDDLLAGRAADEGTWNNRSVRWNLIKLVQEYARHNGHADLIRERLDGAVGE